MNDEILINKIIESGFIEAFFKVYLETKRKEYYKKDSWIY